MVRSMLLILMMLLGVADWEMASQEPSYKVYYSEEQKTSKWVGYPDPNYSWEGERLVWERIVKDEDGKDQTVKTYKKPIEIIADFKPESKIFGVEGNIERNAVKKFGGALKGFVWLDNVSGGGEVTLPFTAPHIFIARGDRLNPELTEISTDPNSDNWYEVIEGKTRVVVKSFSGIGGAAGAPPTLVAHYKFNDKLATTVVIDETGNHNGTAQQNTDIISVAGKINTAFDFNGSSDYIEIPDHADFSFVGVPSSTSIWINPATVNIDQKIIAKALTVASGISAYQIRSVTGNPELIFQIYSGGSWRTLSAPNYFLGEVGNWIHLVVTMDSLNYVTIYKNGEVFLSSTDMGYPIESSTGNLFIGKRDGGSPDFLEGLIDNVMFFGTELLLREVDFLYNYGMGREDFVHPMPLFLGTNF